MNSINDIIVTTALKYVRQTEISGNMGFVDDTFQSLIESCGWEKSQAWCAYFAELVWKEAYQQYDSTVFPLLDVLFNAGAVATYNNFRKSKEFTVSNIPQNGSLVIWQTYKEVDDNDEVKLKPYWTGHVGIVESFYKDVIKTIEGNTNSLGGREGIEVAQKIRELDFSIKKGLVLKGFVHPKISI